MSFFGATASPAPTFGAFGAAGFGTPAPVAAAPAPSFGGFGAQAAPPAFGAAPAGANPFAVAPAPTPSPFGSFTSLQAGQPAANAFGSSSPFGQQPLPSPALQPTPAGPATLQPAAEVGAVEAALDPKHEKFALRALLPFADLPASQRVRPPNVDELTWREALAACDAEGAGGGTSTQWPRPVDGFAGLAERYGAQQQALQMLQERCAAAESALAARQAARRVHIVERCARVVERQEELGRRLLHCARAAEAAEAAAAPWQPDPLNADELALRQRLAAMQTALDAGGTALRRRTDTLRAAASARPRSAAAAHTPALDAESRARLASVLGAQAEAVARLGGVVKRDERDVAILEQAGGGVADMQ